MPLARLAQYQHCLLRRNGTAVRWSNTGGVSASVLDELRVLRERWTCPAPVDSAPGAWAH